MRLNGKWAIMGLAMLAAGCAQRQLVINSEPSGAIVYLNGDEVGRTPLKYDFHWYGDYDVAIRKEGYETLKTHRVLKGKLNSYPPFDLLAELFGDVDRREWTFQLVPASPGAIEPGVLISRAKELEGMLQSSERTRIPSTLPARTRTATTRPSTQPASQPGR